MASTDLPRLEEHPDVLRLALINHFKANLRKQLLEAAKAEIDNVVEQAANSLKVAIEERFEDYGRTLVFNLMVDGVDKAFD